MKYTKEDIEKIKNDPWMRLLALFAGKNLDDIIEEVESSYTGEGDLHWDKKNGITKEEKPDTRCSFKEDAPTPIINKDVYNSIIDYVFTYKGIVHKLEDFGLGFNFGEEKCIINPLINIIISLLASIWNDDFASSFINLVFDDKADRDDFVELYKMYCE